MIKQIFALVLLVSLVGSVNAQQDERPVVIVPGDGAAGDGAAGGGAAGGPPVTGLTQQNAKSSAAKCLSNSTAQAYPHSPTV